MHEVQQRKMHGSRFAAL